MTPREAVLTSLLNFPEEFKVTDRPYPRKGLFIGSLSKCARYLLIAMRVPREINGVKVTYIEQVQMNSNGSYIVAMGNEIENVLRKHLNYKKIPIHADQMMITALDGGLRGRLDFGIEVPGIGMCIIDAKGMSDSVFARFQVCKSVKEFKEDYFLQVLNYINHVEVDYGFIVGINRNNGAVAVKEIVRKDNKEYFDQCIDRSKRILTTNIEDLTSLEPEKDEVCVQCEFISACRPELFATLDLS